MANLAGQLHLPIYTTNQMCTCVQSTPQAICGCKEIIEP